MPGTGESLILVETANFQVEPTHAAAMRGVRGTVALDCPKLTVQAPSKEKSLPGRTLVADWGLDLLPYVASAAVTAHPRLLAELHIRATQWAPLHSSKLRCTESPDGVL